MTLGELALDDVDGELLVFYFAGHGAVVGDHGYLVTVDGTPYDPGISLAHLAQLMDRASEHYAHVITILDSCHSGSALNWPSARQLRSNDVEREVQAVTESRCVLAACRPDQAAMEVDGHGVFTKHLVNGLLEGAVDFDGNITLFGLYDYITRTMPEDAQTPVFKGDVSGKVVLAQGFAPRIGKPLAQDETTKTLAKARAFVDEYYAIERRQTEDLPTYIESGALTCASELGPRLDWFAATERELPEVQRIPDWVRLRNQMQQFQSNLARVYDAQMLPHGRVTRHLGQGGFGHVWELRSNEGHDYAFKVFHGNELDDRMKVHRFEHGYVNMRKLQHPRIVKVHDLLQVPFGILMDAIPGDNLHDAYWDRRDAALSLRLLQDVAETIQHAHGRGVIHRDIKPGNIILVTEADGAVTPYLTDFDLAYHETNRTLTTNLGVGGVLNYAAPEQLYKPNTAQARAATVDIFSLAQLTFYVIVGEDPRPQSANANLQRMRQTLNEWVDGQAAQILLDLYTAATQIDPKERLQDITAFATTLAKAESHVLASSGRGDVEEDAFATRLGHLVAGVGNYHATEDRAEFASLSRQIQVVARNRGWSAGRTDRIDIEVEFEVTGNLPIPGFTSGASGRANLNARIDKNLGRYKNVTRHAGTRGVFQTYVKIRQVPLSIDGLAMTQEIIATVVASIEQW